MRLPRRAILLPLLFVFSLQVLAQRITPDMWVFTDGLGRKSLGYEEVGPRKKDKTLALFYWTWHTAQGQNHAPQNNQEVMTRFPEAVNDFQHPAWKTGAQNFWNEPVFGYYLSNDVWVLRKQAELLADAGVDVIFTDNTNGRFTWKESYDPLFTTWMAALQDGVKPPKVSFMLPFAANEDSRYQLRFLYEDIFAPGKYRPLWFFWNGKPLIMAHPDNLSTKDATDAVVRNFFTFRPNYPGYINREPAAGNWGWLSIYPQAVYYATEADKAAGRPEQITVGIAHNHDYVQHELAAMNGHNIMGRSYTSRGYHREPDASKYGFNFAEQAEYALKINPRVLFVTGWNEWIAGRFASWPPIPKTCVENAFPDEFTDEFSRDLEPSRGDLKDHYFYQFVNMARRFKGVSPIPPATGMKTIDIHGNFSQWDAVQPSYEAYRGNTIHRNADGYKTCHYTDFSGRNDIVGAKVTQDESMVYFMVECAEDITPCTDPLWMHLYIDSIEEAQGWNTFDFVVNKKSPETGNATLERFTGNGYESLPVCKVAYQVNGQRMMLAIPRAVLETGDGGNLNFAWTDNVHDFTDTGVQDETGQWRYQHFSGDILDFYTSGDVAPGGRFKYPFRTR